MATHRSSRAFPHRAVGDGPPPEAIDEQPEVPPAEVSSETNNPAPAAMARANPEPVATPAPPPPAEIVEPEPRPEPIPATEVESELTEPEETAEPEEEAETTEEEEEASEETVAVADELDTSRLKRLRDFLSATEEPSRMSPQSTKPPQVQMRMLPVLVMQKQPPPVPEPVPKRAQNDRSCDLVSLTLQTLCWQKLQGFSS